MWLPNPTRDRTLPNRGRRNDLRPAFQPRIQPNPCAQVSVASPGAGAVANVAKPVLSRPARPFRFFDLPGEIRNRIYDLVVPEARVIVSGTHPQKQLQQLKKREPKKKHQAPRYHLQGTFAGGSTEASLLFSCRQMNCEAVQYVYARTTFCFTSFVVLRKFLGTVPEAARSSIVSLEITHIGYGEPPLLADREWKLRHDAKWSAVLNQVKQQTALRRLVIDITNFDWPIQLEAREPWAKPLLALGADGLDRVDVTLEHDGFPRDRCTAAAKELENRMMTREGRKQKRQEEKRKAADDKKRLEEATRKATKVLTIKLPSGATQISGPVKKVVRSKGLEQYAVAQPPIAFC
ncbi:hypothetical protein G647_01676 [Cladophialophora carrionii CBS 160.54]|uniref:DUF7730 domain-containing protein n=1 Tax=Cladophialophora carrionii CBS 160.54 TaxID=1279043 RepID=V9DSB9_9EURO|nr:uncharacterized protein G647_01676 [Cladophialophora carrionii CBS 160.54]ETI29223.1 hypothetical protein G647_01676 [Cladophialophora carrionii CBS 160.54]